MRNHYENRVLIQNMNMERRKRMQSAYRIQLVEDLMAKKQRACSIEKIRADMIINQTQKSKALSSHWATAVQAGVRTLQPVTMEMHKKEYEIERKRKLRAKAESGAN